MPPGTDRPNIYIIGPQSTGKTTLVKKLQTEAESWISDNLTSSGTPIEKPQIVSEVARGVLVEHQFTAEDIRSSSSRCLALQKLILEAQAVAEREALQQSSWFISDRSGVDPVVHARKYVSIDAAREMMQREPAWMEAKARMTRSLIVVCEAGTPWLTNDGVRLMPDSEGEWMQLFDQFCALLDEVGLQYCVVPRAMLDVSQRAEFVFRNWVARRQELYP